MRNDHYDVIIVGGRPAGSTLAARLGQQGMRVLLLERGIFPSPHPASCPVIYARTLAMLDETGAGEADYARNTPRIRRWVTEVRDDFRTFNKLPLIDGRDYGYAPDRARFDDALWRNAVRYPTVTGRQGFSVSDVLRDGERVTGIRGRASGGAEETFTADCVIGADGRFSLIARKVGAQSFEEHDEYPTACYYAYWKNAEPYDSSGDLLTHIYTPGTAYGYGFLVMHSADGNVCVAVEGKSSALDFGAGKANEAYMQLLRKHPRIWRRLTHAEPVTEVHGMRNIGNLYRAGGGPGWALVGDALHQKDPLDGQGIYDAVFTAKVLAQAIHDWKSGAKTWAQAIAWYEAEVRAETHPMYLATIDRVRREIYTPQSDRSYRSVIRWLASDPEYKRRLGLLLVRAIEPTNWLPQSLIYKALLRGALGDLYRAVTRQPRPEPISPLTLDPAVY